MTAPCPAPGTPLPFEKALNFRELGGYTAAGGRTVRRGLLWRSAALDEFDSAADRALYESLGLRYILDLRSSREAGAHPDRIPAGARYERISAMAFYDGSEIDFSPAGMGRMAAEHERLAAELGRAPSNFELFAAFYRRMPFANPAYRALFAALEKGAVPLLFHCSAGKDRTGVAAMLILLALGADRATALRDYMQTNICRKPAIDAFFAAHAGEEHSETELREAMAIEGVDLAMGAGALDAIEARYPSYEAYFSAEFGLDAARLAALRERYLE